MVERRYSSIYFTEEVISSGNGPDLYSIDDRFDSHSEHLLY